jgi:5'-3' exonuclease
MSLFDNEKVMLVDFSNIAWATFHTNQKITKDSTLTEELRKQHWKFLMLNRLLRLKNKHQPGEIVVCFDSFSWRKKVFPFYKARREITKKKSGMDYEGFIAMIDEVFEDLRVYFPYKVCRVEYAEADDIIGALVHHLRNMGRSIVIASRDKDFKQLLHGGVSLWDSIDWKWIRCDNPKTYLIKHVLMGDAGDDIPNVRSPDDVFITEGERQKPCGPKTVEKILGEIGLEEYIKSEGLIKNFRRNKKLIRLTKQSIPGSIWNATIKNYDEQETKKGNYMLLSKYFQTNRMRKLQKSIDQFFLR